MEQWATGLNTRNVFGELLRAFFNASESADRYCLFVARWSRGRKAILIDILLSTSDPGLGRECVISRTGVSFRGGGKTSEGTNMTLGGGADESEDDEDGMGVIGTNGDFNDNTGGSGG